MQDAAFPFLVAMGAPPNGAPAWVSFIPFAASGRLSTMLVTGPD